MNTFKVILGIILTFAVLVYLLYIPRPVKALTISDFVWSTPSNGPSLSNLSSMIYNNFLFTFGGSVADDYSTIGRLNIISDGLTSDWSSINDLPSSSYWHSTLLNSNKVYVLGGTNFPPVNSTNEVKYSTVNSGNLSSWTVLNSLPKRLSKGKSVIVNNRIYFVGGATWTGGGNPTISDSVYYADINGDGTIGTWQTATSLPTPLSGHGLIEANGKLLTIGGSTDSGETAINKVYTAVVNADGTLGSWSEGPTMPGAVRDGAVIKVGNYVISVGGYGGGYSNKVYFAKINSNGNLNPWETSGNNFPIAHCCGAIATLNDYLYLLGGYNATNGINSTKVYVSKLQTASLTPTIIIPGMGGSWNYEAIVHNTAVADTSWTLTPSITVYEGLITTLKNSGYSEGTNLWVYYYDWRKNISDTAANLASFINSKGLSSVNLIGHSQGGLVARKYAQDNSSKINKLITIASPHTGALPVFKIWEGADFSDFPSWQNILLKLYLRINRKSNDNDVKTIQTNFPSLQNILPTFEYFNSGFGTKSNFLGTLTNSNLYTLTGTDLSTPKTYTITPRGAFDKLMGRWSNGKPIGTSTASGDGTVLLTSGQVAGEIENTSESGQDHQAIVSNSVTLAKIQSILGISGTISTSTQDSLANALIITTASPVNFTVTTPSNSTLLPTDNLLVVNNPVDGNYTVNITPNGSGGAYTVYFGKIKGSDWAWEEAASTITSGTKTHVFGVFLSQVGLGSNPLTNALNHNNNALTAVSTNAILKQDVLRIKSYINDLNTAAANLVAGFDLRAGRLFSAIDTLIAKAKNTTVTQSMRLIKSDIEQLRGDRFGN